ncbi:KamA family radical SAM protein [Paremcibacter congregatus]|uniref:KamA family radical SAM protein n=1 Tax=Paremcibacter congregatus TaxID=2043170 RepID=UPI003A8CE47A
MNILISTKKAKHTPTEREKEFLDKVQNTKYDRQIISGIKKFTTGQVPEDMKNFYSAEELQALKDLKGTGNDVEARMPVKITRHYFDIAKNSTAIQTLVKASPAETFDLDGAADPGKQMSYSPVEGLIHKYELGLIYVVGTCSAHCRFCYREELIAKKEIKREDGTIAPKGMAQVVDIVKYIKEHNQLVEQNGGRHPETGRERLREILMSGGDPMVLTNKNIAQWLAALSEAGIESIRIGTKELAFYPERFDATFFDMLDKFHVSYPQTRLRIMVHFNHPDEFLKKDEDNNYIKVEGGGLEWLEKTKRAITELGKRQWLTVDNQAPIIKNINNDPDALRIMQRELKRNKVENHYFFCGRDIIGHKAFNVPIEEAWHILNESQKGLSGVETHARLSITHYKGKTEVVTVSNEPAPGIPGGENGVLVMKLLRGAADAPDRGKVTILGRNPEAIWFSGYNDRVIFDEAGLFVETQ